MNVVAGLLSSLLRSPAVDEDKQISKSHPKFAGSGPGYAEHTKISPINIVTGKRTKNANNKKAQDAILLSSNNDSKQWSEMASHPKYAMVMDLNAEIFAKSRANATARNKTSIAIKSVAQRHSVSERAVKRAESYVKKGKSSVGRKRNLDGTKR